ncbi:MAG: L-threonylcarbamoyladenylate synthase [Chloroflexota bacterium]|nr:L-threonylcarbamoyladenylate synthase [Chloroflexota bacterium]
MLQTERLPFADPNAIPTAKRVIASGGLIAFPTDTIYGVAADPFNPIAIQRIYEAKERPETKALPVLIGEVAQLAELSSPITDKVEAITRAFWPGALTLILTKVPGLPAELSPYPTIGVRMPDLPATLALLRATGPLATTSANISDGPNPVSAEDVLNQLGGRIELLLDGGPTPGPMASTVVDLTQPEMKILREGPIALSDLQACLPKD